AGVVRITAGWQADGIVLEALIALEVRPGLGQCRRRAIFSKEPAIERSPQHFVVRWPTRLIMNEPVKFDAVLIGEDGQRQCIVASGREARVGIDPTEKRLLEFLPMRKGSIVEMKCKLQVAGRIPAIVKAAIGAAR